MRLVRARGLVELGKVASGSTTQDLWLGDRKVGSQIIIGEDRSRLSRRGTVWKVREEEWEPATERWSEYLDLGLELGERKKHVSCHASALAMTDEACREAEI